jgi:hypothetical protein
MAPVPRLALALIVALLSFSASGVSTLIGDEPCVGLEQAGDDQSCPPTCVTCGCCAQGVEPVALQVATAPDVPPADTVLLPPELPEYQPQDILHVPKRARPRL